MKFIDTNSFNPYINPAKNKKDYIHITKEETEAQEFKQPTLISQI